MNTKEKTILSDTVYIVESDTVFDLLNQIDDFKEKMASWISKHPNYEYEIDLVRKGKKCFEAEVKVIKYG